jgi:heterodisulfide reductase subunit C
MKNKVLAPGEIPVAERALRGAFGRQMELIPGSERISRCLQCGTCTGSCPVSYAMDVSPRMVIGLYRAGEIEKILKSRTIWICASCYMCTTRCPQGIKITDLLYALKRTAMETGLYPEQFPVYRLSQKFIETVNRYGRNHEPTLVGRYDSVWNLLKNATLGWKFWRRGRLPLRPEKIRGVEAIRKILAASKELELPRERVEAGYTPGVVGYGAVGRG